MHHHHISCPRDAADRCDVSHEIEAEICVERGVDRIRGANLQKRIAIGGCLHDRLGGDGAGSARSVLDYELLAQPVRQPLSHQACRDVGGSASRKADDNADRPRRIGLRPRYARYSRERGSTRCQMQELSSVGKFHRVSVPPGRRTVKTEPLPSSLVTVTSPPIMRASLRVMARPRPVPPNRCAVEASAWVNSSNSLARCSGVMPIPVSATASSIQSRPLATQRAPNLISPSLVNLQALLKRLSRICRSRIGSTVSTPRFSSTSIASRFLFCSAS